MRLDVGLIERVAGNWFELPLTIAIADAAPDQAMLSPDERIRHAALDGRRGAEWLTGRAALKRVLARLGEDEDTAEIGFPNPRYSLSHSNGCAIAVGTGPSAALGLGIDLELDRLPSLGTARFFLAPAEHTWLADQAEADRPRQLRRLWSIKEAAFKADPDNCETSFIDYVIEKPAAARGRASIARGQRSRELLYACFDSPQGVVATAVLDK